MPNDKDSPVVNHCWDERWDTPSQANCRSLPDHHLTHQRCLQGWKVGISLPTYWSAYGANYHLALPLTIGARRRKLGRHSRGERRSSCKAYVHTRTSWYAKGVKRKLAKAEASCCDPTSEDLLSTCPGEGKKGLGQKSSESPSRVLTKGSKWSEIVSC